MSNLVVSNISDGTTSVGTGYVVNGSAKAWVNFNASGTTTINNSFNISSLTDNGTGLTYINLSSAMAYSLFSLSHSAIVNSNYADAEVTNWPVNASQIYFVSVEAAYAYDKSYASCIAHGDLA